MGRGERGGSNELCCSGWVGGWVGGRKGLTLLICSGHRGVIEEERVGDKTRSRIVCYQLCEWVGGWVGWWIWWLVENETV